MPLLPGRGLHRKGQITILLVLVVVLLILFGLLFFMRADLARLLMPDPGTVLDAASARRGVTEAVEACVQRASQEGLVLAGSQGGALYSHQVEGGALFVALAANGELTLPYDGADVSFAIRESGQSGPPEYPVPGPIGSAQLEGLIGVSTLLPLCDADGPNAWGRLEARYTCIDYDFPGSPHSIQDYLRRFILNRTLGCIDFQVLEDAYGIAVRPIGAPEMNVTIGDADVTAQFSYQLDLGGTTVGIFTYQSPVRLKKVYELAYRLAEADNSDLALFIDDPVSLSERLRTCPSVDRTGLSEPCLKEGMNVTVIDAPCATCSMNRYADVVRITDGESLIGGQPYVFQFSRENRRPALDLIDESAMSGAYSTYLQRTHGISKNPYFRAAKDPYPDSYDILLTEGDVLHVIPYGLDPDEDSLTYSYSGWRTGTVLTDHRHQRMNCMGPGPCLDPFGYAVDPSAAGMAGSVNFWEQTAQGDWRTHRTSYATTAADVGYRMVRLSICDTAGLCDWQDIGVLINDRMVFTADIPSACCRDCPIILSSGDKYYADYRVEIFDSQTTCLNVTKSSWPISVTYGGASSDCGDGIGRQLTLRVTDDFGSSAEMPFTACQ